MCGAKADTWYADCWTANRTITSVSGLSEASQILLWTCWRAHALLGLVIEPAQGPRAVHLSTFGKG